MEDVAHGKTAPVGFMSRKLTQGQKDHWTPREKETYAIFLALRKWETVIGFQPVLVLSDHKALEKWAQEALDTPSGPLGRRARWHEYFSRFRLLVGYTPGKCNVAADALSRWAYPASQGAREVCKHGAREDKVEMEALEREEQEPADEAESFSAVDG